MKPSEMTNELLTRITRTTRVIKESFSNYGGVTPDPLNNWNDRISNHAFWIFKRQYTPMMFNFFKMNLFKAALTPELRSIVPQQDQETMTIKKMYQVATTVQWEGKGKTTATVNKICDKEILADPEDKENDVTAFNWRGAQPKMNQSSSQSNWGGYGTNRGNYQAGSGFNRRGGSSGGNNSNQNNKFCYFCKLQRHRQEQCPKRIKENRPCQDAQGQTYWPRIYFMEENQDAKSVNAINFPEEEIQDDDEEHRFDIARFKVDNQECKTRTAALPQQN
jgi:hypothetical protein